MASTKATGLLMPRSVTGTPGYVAGPRTDTTFVAIPEHPGYILVPQGQGVQPGPAEGDTNLLQTDDVDDENLSGTGEVGAVAIPHFPRGGSGNRSAAHHFEFTTTVRSKYIYGNAAYKRTEVGRPEDDLDEGPWEDDPTYSEMAGVSEKDASRRGVGQYAKEARRGNLAHNPAYEMIDTDVSETGATGIWSIAGHTS